MFSRPKPPNKDQQYTVQKLFAELKNHFELYKQLMDKPFPETPQPWESTEKNMRQSLLDQRAYLMDIKKPLELIDSTIGQIIRAWPEGKRPFTILTDWLTANKKQVDNFIEANRLWDGPDPTGSIASKKRQQLTTENRRLQQVMDDSLARSAEQIYNLTGINILNWIAG